MVGVSGTWALNSPHYPVEFRGAILINVGGFDAMDFVAHPSSQLATRGVVVVTDRGTEGKVRALASKYAAWFGEHDASVNAVWSTGARDEPGNEVDENLESWFAMPTE